MNLTFPQLLAGSIGALLIYCAVVGKTPVAALKDAFASQATAPGTNINPTATGQASYGLSSGHSINGTNN